jgi:hypothetical protein
MRRASVLAPAWTAAAPLCIQRDARSQHSQANARNLFRYTQFAVPGRPLRVAMSYAISDAAVLVAGEIQLMASRRLPAGGRGVPDQLSFMN